MGYQDVNIILVTRTKHQEKHQRCTDAGFNQLFVFQGKVISSSFVDIVSTSLTISAVTESWENRRRKSLRDDEKW